VKRLLDANVSPTLVSHLKNEYPDSIHVRDAGLRHASDPEVWDYARMHGFAIVSKDTDFRERSFVEGFPPKVIWLDVVGHYFGAIDSKGSATCRPWPG
jgi:predicted nuclease of predicted toxin-antitoxin system